MTRAGQICLSPAGEIVRYKAPMTGLSMGSTFAGYLVEDVLSRGGMGIVYRARELRPERVVALKVIAPELAAEPQFRTRFLQESQLAAAIEHPHVVPVLRVGEENGLLFIAMRLIRGRDLATIIGEEGRLEPARIAGLIDQVADALDTAHGMGLVHRDVKPANILVESHRRGEHAYLTDFGLTKAFASTSGVTSTGVVVGTVDYMAPEQLEGGALDARTDVYSLGCVLFQGLTGEVPYPRENRAARMYAHLHAPPPAVSERVPELPPQFDEVVQRGLAKDPRSRYPSAGDLARAGLAAAQRQSPAAVGERSVGTGEAAPVDPGAADPVGSPARSADDAQTLTLPHSRSGHGLPRDVDAPSGPPPRHRRRALGLGAVAAVAVAAVAVVALVVPSHGQASAARVAQDWLRLHEAGNDGQAAALWKAPVTFVEAFPSIPRRFGSNDQVRSYWSGRPCSLTLIRTTTVSDDTAVLRLRADGERYGGASKCGSNGTVYDDRFTVRDGHIVSVVSQLAPISVAQTWLRLHDGGDDQTASTLWARSGSVTTVSPHHTFALSGTAAIAAFWSTRGCHLKPLDVPREGAAGHVALRVLADAQRPNVTRRCLNISTSYHVDLAVSSGRITSLAFSP
jgi:serine/threonine protein kinase